MSDDTAFLRAIIEHPGDDGPRLVYADWLDEQGQAARAEFIRIQCELAADWSCCRCTRHQRCGFCRLQRRERELWGDAQPSEWFPTVPLPQTISQSVWEGAIDNRLPTALIRRGFIDSLILSPETLLGGPCGRCFGEGGITPAAIWETCPRCCGTGRIVGCADLLLWRPGMTDGCGRCAGRGYTARGPSDDCPACQGEGRLPRPCPPTAQPIRRVVLTTTPEWDDREVRARYFGITFEYRDGRYRIVMVNRGPG
jgi:uncharacterized protein (TIGR02996 family)